MNKTNIKANLNILSDSLHNTSNVSTKDSRVRLNQDSIILDFPVHWVNGNSMVSDEDLIVSISSGKRERKKKPRKRGGEGEKIKEKKKEKDFLLVSSISLSLSLSLSRFLYRSLAPLALFLYFKLGSLGGYPGCFVLVGHFLFNLNLNINLMSIT
jgi:hypothetical protein